MVVIMRFYTVSHGKFHDRGCSNILYGISSIDIMRCCTPEHSVMSNYHLFLPIIGDVPLSPPFFPLNQVPLPLISTVNIHIAWFPVESTAWHVTSVSPIPN